jgi:putative DNA primase/helicase
MGATDREGRWTKPPRQPSGDLAESNNPATWSTYDAVLAAVERFDGIGIMVRDLDLASFDLDKCRNPETGEIEPWAQDLIARLPGAYTEVTVSGTGLRMIATGTGDPVQRRFTIDGNGQALELFRRCHRYITISGNQIGSCDELPNGDGLMDALLAQYDRGRRQSKQGQGNGHDHFDWQTADWQTAGKKLSPELIQLIRDGVGVGQRSEAFHSAVAQLKRRRWREDNIYSFFAAYPGGVAAKYADGNRLRDEVRRSYEKCEEVSDGDGNVIQISPGCLPELATEGERALLRAGVPFYSHAEELQRPIVDEVQASGGRKAKIARLTTVTLDMLRDYLARSARWEKYSERKKKFVRTDPPREVAATILSRIGEWQFARTVGVITTPTLRPDGTILSEPGYDLATRLILMDPPAMPDIPERPTRAMAEEALGLLDGLLDEFPFVDEPSRAVALSELISPVVRGAMGRVPLHANTSPAPGTGKSYIFDLAAAIVTGHACPVISAGQDEHETEKRLASGLLRGQSIISIDNLNGELRSDALCQMIERPIVEIRPLGASRLVRVESRTTVFCNGNNLTLVGDLIRRSVRCSLDANVERPELRRFRGNPLDEILSNRPRYIAAALIISRAYLVAGCPDPLPPLASFEDWSRLVRSALVWLGRADPVETMETARDEDPELETLRRIVGAWSAAIGIDRPVKTKEMAELAEQRKITGDYADYGKGEFAHPDLREALLSVAYGTGGNVNTKALGRWLGAQKGRIVLGCKIIARDDTDAKQKRWSLRKVTA